MATDYEKLFDRFEKTYRVFDISKIKTRTSADLFDAFDRSRDPTGSIGRASQKAFPRFTSIRRVGIIVRENALQKEFIEEINADELRTRVGTFGRKVSTLADFYNVSEDEVRRRVGELGLEIDKRGFVKP